MQSPQGGVISRIVTGTNQQPELEEIRRSYWKDRIARATIIIERARAREELPEGVDAAFLIEMAIGPIMVRANATDRPLNDLVVEQAVDLLLNGARKPGL
jgi:hypothetical protein